MRAPSKSSATEGHDPNSHDAGRMRFLSVVWRLTGANSLIVILALATSPILARALGPSGRGELAAIFTLITLAPWISDLGLTAFLTRERARGEPSGLLLGSAMPLALSASLIGVLAAVPLAHLMGQSRPTVVLFIELGLFTLPFSVFAQTLYGLLVGEERWRIIVWAKVLGTAVPAAAIVVLSLLGHLTVENVAIVYLISNFIALAPFLIALRHSIPWRWRWGTTRRAFSFGVKSWLTTIAVTTNARVDQLIMAGVVSSRELGLYALAVTLAGASGSLIGAVSNALFPRIAGGEAALGARACRISTTGVTVLGVGIAISAPVFVPAVFGSDFSAAVPILLVLLAASISSVAGQILTTIVTARAQGVGLAITIPGLLVLLPSAGAMGAAWISLASYTATTAIVLVAAVRLLELPATAFLVPRREDLDWILARFDARRRRRVAEVRSVG